MLITKLSTPSTTINLVHCRDLIEYFDIEVKNIPGIEAEEVAKVISKALVDAKPKSQYLIDPGAMKMKVLSLFPVKMRDNMLYKAIHKS